MIFELKKKKYYQYTNNIKNKIFVTNTRSALGKKFATHEICKQKNRILYSHIVAQKLKLLKKKINNNKPLDWCS